MASEDDELQRTQREKHEPIGLPSKVWPAEIQPVELPCKICGRGIPRPVTFDCTPQAVAEWNRMAGQTPRFTCAACRDADRQRRRQEAQDAARRARQAELESVRADLPSALAGCGVPEHWRHASLDCCPDLPPALIDLARRWAESPFGIIYLHGPPGAGKTYLAVAMLAHALAAGLVEPAACRYVGERDFLDELKASFDSGTAPVSSRSLPPSHPRRAGLLLYDDMGAARQTDWTRGEIADLIAARHAADLPTIVTANVSPDGLALAIDGRVASRLAEYRMMLEFPTVDLRAKGTVRP
jgi:DNA replication protein DnaC